MGEINKQGPHKNCLSMDKAVWSFGNLQNIVKKVILLDHE